MSCDLPKEFWDWAVGRYESAELREELLELQESTGLIILEAMFLAWLGLRGQAITQLDYLRIHEEITPWVEGVVIPLRQQRHQWTDDPSMVTNRGYLLGLELEAERLLANLLIASSDIAPVDQSIDPKIDKNLAFLPQLQDAVIRARVSDMLGQ